MIIGHCLQCGKVKNMPENNKEKETEEKETIEQEPKKELEKAPEIKEIKAIEKALTQAKLPPETLQKFTALIRSERIGPLPDPIISKLTHEHITKMIECTDDDNKRNYNFSIRSQVFNFIYLLLGLGFLIFIIIFLGDKESLLKDILLAIIAFAGGTGAGIGYKTIKSK